LTQPIQPVINNDIRPDIIQAKMMRRRVAVETGIDMAVLLASHQM
jgi:hypothetical protein